MDIHRLLYVWCTIINKKLRMFPMDLNGMQSA